MKLYSNRWLLTTILLLKYCPVWGDPDAAREPFLLPASALFSSENTSPLSAKQWSNSLTPAHQGILMIDEEKPIGFTDANDIRLRLYSVFDGASILPRRKLPKLLRSDESARPPEPPVGIEWGAGEDLENIVEEVFTQKGLRRRLDPTIKFKVRPNRLGFQARYANFLFLKELQFDVELKEDVPKFLGIDSIWDKVYGLFGQDWKGNQQKGMGFKSVMAINNYWGLYGYYSDGALEEEEVKFSQLTSFGVGYTPLGANENRPWNFSLIGSFNYAEKTDEEHPSAKLLRGIGYAAGIGFRYALDRTELPWIHDYAWAKKNIKLDYARVNFFVLDSELYDVTLKSAIGVTAYLTKHLKGALSFKVEWVPQKNEWDVGPHFGVSIQF